MMLFEGLNCAAVQIMPRATSWADAVAVANSLEAAPYESLVPFSTDNNGEPQCCSFDTTPNSHSCA